MSGVRFFLYTHSGEILTFLILLVAGIYLHQSLSRSTASLVNEAKARDLLHEVYRLEMSASHTDSGGRYLLLSRLLDRYPDIAGIETIASNDGGSAELCSDEHYLYAFQLDFPILGAKQYQKSGKTGQPTGFRIMAWPILFARDGELAFYIDQQGRMAVTTNERAFYEDRGSFPPDWDPPVDGLKGKLNSDVPVVWEAEK